MLAFAITARFPLGVYQAHTPGGLIDPYPQPARLHAALTHAAHTGTTALSHHDTLQPTVEALEALSWLENNPPDAIHIPNTTPLNGGTTIAYRDEGTNPKEQKTWTDKKVGKPTADGTAIAGPITWAWNCAPPGRIADAIDALCNDIACLGEATSPVVLTTHHSVDTDDALKPTHVLRHDIDPGTPGPLGTLKLALPAPGRYEALQQAHLHAYPAKKPTSSADRHGTGDAPQPSPVSRAGLDNDVAYTPVAALPSAAPWSTALIFPICRLTNHHGHTLKLGIDAPHRVGWCSALHKATMRLIGDAAPPLITGITSPGQPRPSNRVAFTYLPPATLAMLDPAAHHGIDHNNGSFMVLIPPYDHTATLAMLARAYDQLTRITSRHGIAQVGLPTIVDATQLWKPAAPGHTRTWLTLPAAMPETRRQTPLPGGNRWSLRDAAALSVAFVCKDQLPPVPRGSAGYTALIDHVTAHGVEVWSASRLAPPNPTDYAHKLPHGMVADPYRAHLILGDLIPDQACIAIGQTRHLGGGLLYPHDILSETIDVVRGTHS